MLDVDVKLKRLKQMEKYPLPPHIDGKFNPGSLFTEKTSNDSSSIKSPVALFKPLQISNKLRAKNRIGVAPMCMYSSRDGYASSFHQCHIPQYAFYGAGMIIIEATAVSPEGRISPRDNGIWLDDHIPALRTITDLVRTTGCLVGIQLAHSGRKGSTFPPFIGDGHSRSVEPGVDDLPGSGCRGFDVVAPSPLAYSSKLLIPRELSIEDIKTLVGRFADAAVRSKQAGFDFIEIHAAHGYLIHQFLSPISNRRTDQYGGSFENRIKFCVEVCEAIRKAVDMPIFIRFSCTDFVDTEPSWTLEQTVQLSKLLHSQGLVDLIHASAGSLSPLQKFPELKPGYQVPFAEAIKKAIPDCLVAAVGLITDPEHANEIVEKEQADVVMLAREFLRNPAWPIQAAKKLGIAEEVGWMAQYNRGREPTEPNKK